MKTELTLKDELAALRKESLVAFEKREQARKAEEERLAEEKRQEHLRWLDGRSVIEYEILVSQLKDFIRDKPHADTCVFYNRYKDDMAERLIQKLDKDHIVATYKPSVSPRWADDGDDLSSEFTVYFDESLIPAKSS